MADQRSVFVPFDLDTGGGTEQVLGINLRLSSAGGSIEALGSQVSALSIPVVVASDQGAVSVDTELAAASALSDTFANPTTAPVGAMMMGFDGTDWERIYSVADGDVVAAATTGFLMFGTDGANYQAIAVDATGNVQVDIVSSATLTVDTELPAAAALSDAVANPTSPSVGSHLMGFDRVNADWTRMAGVVDGEVVGALNAGFLSLGTDGTNYQVVATDASGNLQVDVLTGGGSDTPTNPVNDYQTSAALAAGSSVDLTTPEATSKKLAAIEVWSSVAFKSFVHTVDNAVESTDPVAVGGGQADEPFLFRTTHRDYITLGATAGLDAFRVKVTNLDDNLAADVYATFHYED
jgi:hypothetical protein